MALPTKLTLHISSPDVTISQEVDFVSLPGSEGDFGVLPGHTPFFTSLRTGAMWYRQGAETHYLMVSIGFVEVLPDEGRAEAGMKRAEEVMSVAPHEIDFERARLAMLRTLQQMQAASRRGGGHV